MVRSKRTFALIILWLLIIGLPACSSSNDVVEEIDPEEQAKAEALQEFHINQTVEVKLTENAINANPPEDAPAELQTEQPLEQSQGMPLEQTPMPTLDLLNYPGEPSTPDRTLEDADSRARATENRTLSGDDVLANIYERPFTLDGMIYQSDLDITTVDFSAGDEFYYFTINLAGIDEGEWGPKGYYGIEFDRTMTGRGDLLVFVHMPKKDWDTNDIVIYKDQNGDVGGLQPGEAEDNVHGNGYDTQVEIKDDLTAFSRYDPGRTMGVQIAVSRALLGDPTDFLWGAWAAEELPDVSLFDYHDNIGPSEAGSPINGDRYPIKALYSLDNTCRLPYGFEQGEDYVPGMCLIAEEDNKEK